MDPVTLALIGGGASGLSNVLQGIFQSKMQGKQLAEARREFDVTSGMSKGQQALGTQRMIENSPLRDRLMYNITQRAGMAPGRFAPHDMYNPSNGPASPGGIDLNALQQKIGAYSPGAGGVDLSQGSVAHRVMNSLGYPSSTGLPSAPPQIQPPQGFGQSPFGPGPGGMGPGNSPYDPRMRRPPFGGGGGFAGAGAGGAY